VDIILEGVSTEYQKRIIAAIKKAANDGSIPQLEHDKI
jgi:hypothetical protein